MKRFFAYIRVSTAKQGEHGVSLQEQHDAIVRYAEREKLTISEWFEERETAAKRGRPIFNKMIVRLKRGEADGVLIHKIDRSARNLKDWADLGEMIDHGAVVRFVNEALDLNSRGGRLSADIQAVIAADYIRNLSEETRKGFYGRLKQGIYPLPAPLGYLDGKRPKAVDPLNAPLVRLAFELYGSGSYSLHQLSTEMFRQGLRGKRTAGQIAVPTLASMLKNPFYMGLIRVEKTGEIFLGAHVPLVTKSTFDTVQRIMASKVYTKSQNDFLYRRLFRCGRCGGALVGEGHGPHQHVYYRCHRSKGCTSVRDDVLDAAVDTCLRSLVFTDGETQCLQAAIERMSEMHVSQIESERAALSVRKAKLNERLDRLTDAFIDGSIEKDLFERRKGSLLLERKELEDQTTLLAGPLAAILTRLQEKLEFAKTAPLLYKTADRTKKRQILRILSSKRVVTSENIEITLAPPFFSIANRRDVSHGGPSCDIGSGLDRMLEHVLQEVSETEMRIPQS